MDHRSLPTFSFILFWRRHFYQRQETYFTHLILSEWIFTFHQASNNNHLNLDNLRGIAWILKQKPSGLLWQMTPWLLQSTSGEKFKDLHLLYHDGYEKCREKKAIPPAKIKMEHKIGTIWKGQGHLPNFQLPWFLGVLYCSFIFRGVTSQNSSVPTIMLTQWIRWWVGRHC